MGIIKSFLFLVLCTPSILSAKTVKIETDGYLGSGTFISHKNKSYLLTNGHICLGESFTLIKNNKSSIPKSIALKINSQNKTIKTSRIKIDFKNDLCLIPVKHGKSYKVEKAKRMDRIHYYAYNKRLRKTKRKTGLVLGHKTNMTIKGLGEGSHSQKSGTVVSTKTTPGDSGAGVFNSKGNLVGVIFAAGTTADNTVWGLMTSSDKIISLLNDN